MSEKLIVNAAKKTADATQRGLETFVRKARSVMDAASEKMSPSQYLTDRAVRSIQGTV